MPLPAGRTTPAAKTGRYRATCPPRASLLKGRNHHAVGFGAIANVAVAEPGYTSVIPDSAATIGEVLKMNGYATTFFGKNHDTPNARVAGYTLPSGRVTWANGEGDLDLSLAVTSITDEYYFVGAFDNAQSGFSMGQPGRPREWSVSATKRF
ncbi:sulfatase-like hydrolase/transferase [Aurantiacibacter flavus]|uniref:Sulfatase-like hydrolase/transferase n=1 Tax=Aurantiacibacter flavus TaxID=3145232 RepID=A0ABV0CUS8_9SPHN